MAVYHWVAWLWFWVRVGTKNLVFVLLLICFTLNSSLVFVGGVGLLAPPFFHTTIQTLCDCWFALLKAQLCVRCLYAALTCLLFSLIWRWVGSTVWQYSWQAIPCCSCFPLVVCYPPSDPLTHQPIHPLTHQPIHPLTHQPIHPLAHQPIHPPTHQPIHPPAHQPVHPPAHHSVFTRHRVFGYCFGTRRYSLVDYFHKLLSTMPNPNL